MGKHFAGSKRLGVGVSGGGPAFVSLARETRHGQSGSSSASSSTNRMQPNIPRVSVPVPKCGTDLSRRGSMIAALAAAGGDEAFDAAMHALIRDRYAATTNLSRASWLKGDLARLS